MAKFRLFYTIAEYISPPMKSKPLSARRTYAAIKTNLSAGKLFFFFCVTQKDRAQSSDKRLAISAYIPKTEKLNPKAVAESTHAAIAI